MTRTTDKQKKKNILAKLVRRRNIGEKYTLKEKTYSGIRKDQRGNLAQLLDELHKEGFIEYHKGKNCISINRHNKEKVKQFLEDEVPEYLWDNF